MLLVKCKCGCRFTLSENVERKHFVVCPDCEKQFPVGEGTLLENLMELSNSVESVNMIPDGVKLEVSFSI